MAFAEVIVMRADDDDLIGIVAGQDADYVRGVAERLLARRESQALEARLDERTRGAIAIAAGRAAVELGVSELRDVICDRASAWLGVNVGGEHQQESERAHPGKCDAARTRVPIDQPNASFMSSR